MTSLRRVHPPTGGRGPGGTTARTTACLAAATLAAGLFAAPTLAAEAPRSGAAHRVGPPTVKTVTLVRSGRLAAMASESKPRCTASRARAWAS